MNGNAAPETQDLRHGREMAFNRLVFGVLAGLYFAATGPSRALTIAIALYVGFACVLFAWLRWRPSRGLKAALLCALIADVGMISVGMHLNGPGNAALFPLYLWMILGNGFRLGLRPLFVATAVASCGFAAVIAETPYWRDQPALSLSLLASLVMLPIYSSTLIRKLSRARLQAEEASHAKSMFLAAISHELRTPLNAILGSVSLVEDTPLDEEQRSLFDAMRTGTQALLSLIGSILDFSRAEAGLMPVQRQPLDLSTLLVEIRDLLAIQARMKTLQISIHIGPDVPLRILGDRKHLLEVLLNLASNAVKFTEKGGVCISVELMAAEPGAATEPAPRLRFEVSDTGIGIAPEAQSRIFDVFSQADPSILDRYGGTGLGLAICRQLVTLMGGTIGVDSRPGLGSSFWFTLNLAQAEPDTATPVAQSAVLLCDDAALAGEMETILRAQGLRVRSIGELRSALGGAADRQSGGILFLHRRDPAGSLPGDCAVLGEQDPQARMPRILLTGAGPSHPLPMLVKRNFITTLAAPPQGEALGRACRLAGIAAARTGNQTSNTTGQAVAEAGHSRRSLRVLVADDNEINRRVVRKILERSGHRVSTVEDGNQALDAMEAGTFDMVLMDVNMPGMNGLEATRLFRLSMPAAPRLPILALTADATEEMERRCREAGTDACITKPVTAARLIALIDAQFGEDRAPAAGTLDVARLADHPRFSNPARALDPEVMAELRALGGAGFVNELLAGFVGDANGLIERIDAAARAQDMTGFHFELHALCSASANVGATALREAAASRSITQATLAGSGRILVQQLRQELGRVEREWRQKIALPERSSG